MNENHPLDLTKIYIYNNAEYTLTGRVAKKELPQRTRRRRPSDTGTSRNRDILVEIQQAKKFSNRSSNMPPINSSSIEAEKIWVKPSDLFVVTDELDEDDYDDDSYDEDGA